MDRNNPWSMADVVLGLIQSYRVSQGRDGNGIVIPERKQRNEQMEQKDIKDGCEAN